MKLNGFVGKGSGKLGASVFAISGGEQIVRQYNPQVSNPNTAAQIEQRAKLKLMSQVAAVMAPVIAIPKQGLKSARNLFISKNFDLTTYANNTASVDCKSLQITNGSATIPEFMVTTDPEEGNTLVVFNEGLKNVADRVAVCVFEITDDDQLTYVKSVVENASDGNTTVNVVSVPDTYLILAYGIKDKDGNATAKYANYSVADATAIASLVATNSMSVADFTFTATRGKRGGA